MHCATAAMSTAPRRVSVRGISSQEGRLSCSDGLSLATVRWPAAAAPALPSRGGLPPRRILCLHGWLDNSATFDALLPGLHSGLDAQAEIVALDLPGHGLSDHKSPDGPPQLLAEYVYYVSEAIDALGWSQESSSSLTDGGHGKRDGREGDQQRRPQHKQQERITLIGHSMGAGIATIFAAAFPEEVEAIVLIEGTGPLVRRAKDQSNHIRSATTRRKKGNRLIYCKGDGGDNDRKGAAPRIYPSLEAATEVRVKTARLAPGRQYLSREAAAAMVRRATVLAPPSDGDRCGSGSEQAVAFRHDPRLQWPSLHYFTREQVDAIYADVKCPICLLTAEDGWPFEETERRSVEELLRPSRQRVLPGSHHFHADPDTCMAVLEEILAFLRIRKNKGIKM